MGEKDSVSALNTSQALNVHGPVGNDSRTLVFPKAHDTLFIRDHWGDGVEHALPDSRQIPQVEDVMELGWCGQHFDLLRTGSVARRSGYNCHQLDIILMYICYVFVNALGAHIIHINLNKYNILYVRRGQSYQNNLHKALCGNTHTHNDCSRNWVLILVGAEILWEEEGLLPDPEIHVTWPLTSCCNTVLTYIIRFWQGSPSFSAMFTLDGHGSAGFLLLLLLCGRVPLLGHVRVVPAQHLLVLVVAGHDKYWAITLAGV